ncbi:MAG TPA: hypothetical protein VJ987_09035 [Anaerolineales bacterium]|nr:hypothetical protein [Anaerolineales bacterium]
MEDTPFYRKPWFYIFSWLVILLVAYGWQISRMGGIQASLFDIFFDLVCIFPILLMVWMAFFAQFVLPVRTTQDRQKIFNRLLTNLFGGHGPAMFVRNGELIKREGEEKKKGPGVLWLDSASAAVTRTSVKIKQTIGPGVHFIDNGEFIAGTLDLHEQTQSLGPKEEDVLFTDDDNHQGQEHAQERRKMVSALTRDGIELVPTISIRFRVDTGFPKANEPGSRFGYRTGISRKAKENEKKDKDAIKKAILGEGVNPNMLGENTRRRVAWNELPAALAVDVWREYAAKFTLDDLFNAEQTIFPSPEPAPQPTDEEVDPLSQPIRVMANQTAIQTRYVQWLRSINLFIESIIRQLDGTSKTKDADKSMAINIPRHDLSTTHEASKGTALQVINEMVNARLKNPEVVVLDDHGTRGDGTLPSREYKLLQDRGITVLSVGIANLRFKPDINGKIIDKWSASWLKNAEEENKQIKRRQNIMKTSGQEKAIRQYADLLSADLSRKKPAGVKETLKALVMRTRTIIIKNDKLRSEMEEEQQMLEDILRWIEAEE